MVRFVQFRQSLRSLLSNDGTAIGQIRAADRLRDDIVRIDTDCTGPDYRVRVVPQETLLSEGTPNLPEDTAYFGSHWGPYLRAPDLWFALLKRTRDKWSHLSEIADVRYGLKSGADQFFYVRDVTDSYLEQNADDTSFRAATGMPRADFESRRLRLVKSGPGRGELHVIESEYLKPLIKRPTEMGQDYTLHASDCQFMVLQTPSDRRHLAGTHALAYIRWGERRGYQNADTCQSRIGRNREWFDLTRRTPAAALWPKWRWYKFVVPANVDGVLANSSLYEIDPAIKYRDADFWGGLLNSTWTALSTLQHGRPVGNEAAWATMVYDAQMLLVPNPVGADQALLHAIRDSFARLRSRSPLAFLSEAVLRDDTALDTATEFDCADRRELDDLILQLLGISDSTERTALIEELYSYLASHFAEAWEKEKQARINRQTAARRPTRRPTHIAQEIVERLQELRPDLTRGWDASFMSSIARYDVVELPTEGLPELSSNLLDGHGILFTVGRGRQVFVPTSAAQAPLVKELASAGYRGFVRVPNDDEECRRLFSRFVSMIQQRDGELERMVREVVPDAAIQVRVLAAAQHLLALS